MVLALRKRFQNAKIALRLSEKLDRMEEEDERQRLELPERVDTERIALKLTMNFSRAAAVASVEREIEIRRARAAAEARSRATPPTQPVSPTTTPSVERVNEDRERLVDTNRRLERENSALRLQLKQMVRKPEEVKCVRSDSNNNNKNNTGNDQQTSSESSHHRAAVDEVRPDEAEGSKKKDTLEEEGEGEGEDLGFHSPPTEAGAGRISDRYTEAAFSTSGDGGDGNDEHVVSEKRGQTSRSSRSPQVNESSQLHQEVHDSDGSGSINNSVERGEGEGEGGGGGGGGGGGINQEEVEQLVEAETARVLAELQNNPPPSTRALLVACHEADAFSSRVKERWRAAGLLSATSRTSPPVVARNGLTGQAR